MFIDSTYFTGEISINGASTDQALTQAMAQYEKEILISLLGYKLYSLLNADLVAGVPQTQKYLDLVNGAEFTHTFRGEDITLKWEGLINTGKLSLIAYFTYYNYVKRDVSRLMGTGISMAPAGKDWERVSPMHKLCDVWERMREMYGRIPPRYKEKYPYPVHCDNLSYVFNADPSAYNFLFANKTDYPDWIFTPLWGQNVFGI